MSAQTDIIHPRRLYTQLTACPSDTDRAAEALGFACSAASTQRGFLFISQRGELCTLASSSGQAPDANLLAEVQRAWAAEFDLQPEGSPTATVDLATLQGLTAPSGPFWISPSGDSFERRMLGTYNKERWSPVGMVVLQCDRQSLTGLRQAHIDAICNAFLNAASHPEQRKP